MKICTGTELSPHIVDTVFKIFDDDGDGQLSYKEFIAIMRDRLHRGFKVHKIGNLCVISVTPIIKSRVCLNLVLLRTLVRTRF